MFFRLLHDKSIFQGQKWLNKKISTYDSEFDFVVSFRANNDPHMKTKKVKNCSGLSRFRLPIYGRILLDYIDEDCDFAAIIFWDLLHSAKIGSDFVVKDSILCISKFLSPYFEKYVEVHELTSDKIRFTKIASFPAERDHGLSDWSFCIPVGPGDATILNKVVERILSLNFARKEIVLCGRPNKNFKYFDKVRIVGEDIPAPPIWITRKKNVLAKSARYPNLCILHDRVLLPSNFRESMERFGDTYPMVTMQSLFFDDTLNLCPRRYSDLAYVSAIDSMHLFRDIDSKQATGLNAASIFNLIEKQKFEYANVKNPKFGHIFSTGSLYICKRSVWLNTPQNENLYWAEFEDLEHGLRAQMQGIPTMVNSYSISQSVISRPLLSPFGRVHYRDRRNRSKINTNFFEIISLRKKPLINLSESQALKKLYDFIGMYINDITYLSDKLNEVKLKGFTGLPRMSVLFAVLSSSSLRLDTRNVDKFISDFEKQLVCDQLSYETKLELRKQILEYGNGAKIAASEIFELENQISQRTLAKTFYKTPADYFVKNRVLLHLGSFLTAILLWKKRNDYLFIQGSVFSYYKAIINTTPMSD